MIGLGYDWDDEIDMSMERSGIERCPRKVKQSNSQSDPVGGLLSWGRGLFSIL